MVSKEEQLRGGSDQANRRAARMGRRHKAGEQNAPTEAADLPSWDDATIEARRLSARLFKQYEDRWLGTTEAVSEILFEYGVINARHELTGRNALAIAKIAIEWLEAVDSAARIAYNAARSIKRTTTTMAPRTPIDPEPHASR